MGFIPDNLNASDPSRSAFLELGHGHPAHQQHSSGLSPIYPVHGLHTAAHSQQESPFPGNASYGRSLGYAYPGALNAHPASAYMSYQHSNHSKSSSLAHGRLDHTGKPVWEEADACLKSVILAGWRTVMSLSIRWERAPLETGGQESIQLAPNSVFQRKLNLDFRKKILSLHRQCQNKVRVCLFLTLSLSAGFPGSPAGRSADVFVHVVAGRYSSILVICELPVSPPI